MINNLKHKLKILLLMGIAFLLSTLVSNTIFIAATPDINYSLIAQIRSSPGEFARRTGSYVAALVQGREETQQYQRAQVAAAEYTRTPATSQEYAARGYTQSEGGVYTKPESPTSPGVIDLTQASMELQVVSASDGSQVEVLMPL